MPITRIIRPLDPKKLKEKLRDAYAKKSHDEIVTLVKDDLKAHDRTAQLVEASKTTTVTIPTPCTVFLIFGRFEYPIIQDDGTMKWNEVSDGGFGYELGDVDQMKLQRATAVVVLD